MEKFYKTIDSLPLYNGSSFRSYLMTGKHPKTTYEYKQQEEDISIGNNKVIHHYCHVCV